MIARGDPATVGVAPQPSSVRSGARQAALDGADDIAVGSAEIASAATELVVAEALETRVD